jgi:hypothetical protein
MTTITELDVYKVCHGTYEDGYPFDLIFQRETDDETYVGVKRFGNIDVVAFRGSTTLLDWFRNFNLLPTCERGVGWIGENFEDGLSAARANLLTVLGPHVVVTGHSRGAGEATDFACDLVLANRPPLALVALAPPRTSIASKQADLLSSILVRAYRNKGDPVTQVPLWCSHPYPLIDIDVQPPPDDPWGFVAPHHSELYGQAIAKLDPMPLYSVQSP